MINVPLAEGDQGGLFDLNKALVDGHDGVSLAHELHEYDDLNMHDGGNQYGFYPFDLNITSGDDKMKKKRCIQVCTPPRSRLSL